MSDGEENVNFINKLLNQHRENDQTLNERFDEFINEKEDVIDQLSKSDMQKESIIELMRSAYYTGVGYGVNTSTQALNNIEQFISNIKDK